EERDDPGRPGREVLAELVVHLGLDALVDEPADQATDDRTSRGRREQRRRREADEESDRAAPLGALAPAPVRRLAAPDGAVVLVVRDQDRGLDLELLVRDELRERVEVGGRGADVRVAADEDVRRVLCHLLSQPLSSVVNMLMPARPWDAPAHAA